ncbi:MAG: HupE/UreJ family protein [Nitrospiria bacterium]
MMMRTGLCLVLALGVALVPVPAGAHKPSDSYLSLAIVGPHIDGQWDVALRDLDYAIGLDPNDDGTITWGELRARHTEIAAYLLSRLSIVADGRPCPSVSSAHLVDRHTDGTYTVLRFAADCGKDPHAVELGYHLFADLDPQHRGLLRLEYQGQTRTAVFGPDHPLQRFDLGVLQPWRQFVDFGREGVWHIWMGFDHLLFLLALLLPSVLTRAQGRWRAVEAFRPAFVSVLKIVTGFTVAHSITLSLAALGVIHLPSRWVESAIAASVVLGAANNVYPLLHRRLWMVAFGFGLIHGFGFAAVLADLGLPQHALLRALVGFNLGVEVGQLALVAAFLPLAFVFRRSWMYQRFTLIGGSAIIAVVAGMWLIERALDIRLL